MATANLISTDRLRVCLYAATLVATSIVLGQVGGSRASATTMADDPVSASLAAAAAPRRIVITYVAHDRRRRQAVVLLPHAYRPGTQAAIPLVISPHGRAVDGALNSRLWGNLPTAGNFAVVNPDGEGRRLALHSWGAPGQIDDLARMPAIVQQRLPWVHIDTARIYAVGGSMGGQETLLLAGRHPGLLAGAVAVDPVVDFARQYRNYPRLECDARCRTKWGNFGRNLQRLARREIGGTPNTKPAAYAERSPLTYAAAIARSCLPVQIWWSSKDKIVVDPELQSGVMVLAMRVANPGADLDEYVGSWIHTHALNAKARLPMMLAGLGLLPPSLIVPHEGLAHTTSSPTRGCAVGDRG